MGDGLRPDWNHPKYDDWRISDVAATMLECQDNLGHFKHDAERQNQDTFSKPNTSNTGLAWVDKSKKNPQLQKGNIYSITSELLCLPDTLDPRVPKR